MNNAKEYINSELEFGLRSLVLISEFGECKLTFDKLMLLDYMLTNINDFDEEMDSLHPQSPYRFAKVMIKRKVLKDGINMCVKKNLIKIEYSSEGILYSSTVITERFLDYFESSYMCRLKRCSKRLKELYGDYSLKKLQNLMDDKVKKHGIEFYSSDQWERD